MSSVTGPGAELNDAIALNDLEGDFFKIANNKITGKTIAEVPPGSPGLITAPPAGTPANSTLAADVQGFAERWVVDLLFNRITSAIVQRFGTFT